jgi:hypothetical protein
MNILGAVLYVPATIFNCCDLSVGFEYFRLYENVFYLVRLLRSIGGFEDSFLTRVLFNIETIMLFDGFRVFLGMEVDAYALGKCCLTGFYLLTPD